MKKLTTILISLLILGCNSEKAKKVDKNPEQKKNQSTAYITEEMDSNPTIVEENKPLIDQLSKTTDSSANILIDFYNKIQVSDSSEKQLVEQGFFNAFPKSFDSYYKLFGYIDGNPMPLYDEKGMKITWLFYGLKSIEKEKLYNKYFDIAYNGHWEADAIQDFVINEKLRTDTKEICKLLTQRTDEEIKSILHFVYDGPHPEDPGALKNYRITLDSVKKVDSRISTLMEETYQDLIDSSDGHGH